ncbi:hypothetical protein TBR22_A30290 [Luteitalea sp. TBR-22]|uniref:fibronectin type III domain-containing protein n=1 Tax=Luteitalea sp. TBR-22 TaxID=2802971 RepID=UPI001AF0F4BA|nr:fibronectin type III domain-containing protein [Luteitalea sp. TBR-22]BCS33801.1 hypothetical protein TBR22_A30290 [Luteitalea sp. TBR-22]
MHPSVASAAAIVLLLGATPAWAGDPPRDVIVGPLVSSSVGERPLASSSRLAVSWARPDRADHLVVVAREAVQGTGPRVSLAAHATDVTLTGLKADTTYVVTVLACQDEACTRWEASPAVEATTATEYWQLVGAGHTVDRLTTIVADGNARLSATRFGADAGDVAGQVQLYYGPMPRDRRQSLAAAVAAGGADPAVPETFLSFSSRAGSSGLLSPTAPTPLVASLATGQGVPVTHPDGGFVRLFFEAQGADGRTRAMWIDSKDGYRGLDFNAGPGSTCETAADYAAGGGCAPTVAIAVEGDVEGNPRIRNARQFKVAWPTMDAPHWDLSAGTFMVFTTDRVEGCAPASHNHGYAVWDGTRWVVQYREDGCPKLFTSAQAAFPLHAGGVRYRLYYGDPSIQEGRATSNLPFLGPKKLIYADGALTGAPDRVDFEDWEPQDAARDVVFLWPDGSVLDARAEGYIDDYHFLMPTGSPDLQVMYITITDGAIAPIAVAALLRNP